jgi:hypothetical protein
MNEDHVIAAILTAGLISRQSNVDLRPKEVVGAYELMLAELLATKRPPRVEEQN